MKAFFLFTLIFFLVHLTFNAQGNKNLKLKESLIGNWEGAFIKNNSYQKIKIEFYKKSDRFFALQIMDECKPSFGEYAVPVNIDSLENKI